MDVDVKKRKKNGRKKASPLVKGGSEDDEVIDEGFLAQVKANEAKLVVRPSMSHSLGDGLFAAETFRNGEPLLEVRGAFTTESAFEERYGTKNKVVAPWAFPVKPSGYIDARDQAVTDNVFMIRGRMHIGRADLVDNCRIEQRGKRLFVIATTDIYGTSELFCDFGEAYWGKPLHCMWRLLYFYMAVSPDRHNTPYEVHHPPYL